MTRGQLRRMAELARDEGHQVRWEEARGGAAAPFRTIGGLTRLLRRADRIVIGDPFSRYVQLLLTITRAPRPRRRRRRHGDHGVRRPAGPRRAPGALAPQGRPSRAPRDLLLRPGVRRGPPPAHARPRPATRRGLLLHADRGDPRRRHGHRQHLRLDPGPLRPAPHHQGRRHGRHVAGGDRRRRRRPLRGRRRAPSPRPTAPPATSPTAARAPRNSTASPSRRAWRSSAPTCPSNSSPAAAPSAARSSASPPRSSTPSRSPSPARTSASRSATSTRPGSPERLPARPGLPVRRHRNGPGVDRLARVTPA